MASNRDALRSFTSLYSIFFTWLGVRLKTRATLRSHAPFDSSTSRGTNRMIDRASAIVCISFPAEGDWDFRNWTKNASITLSYEASPHLEPPLDKLDQVG